MKQFEGYEEYLKQSELSKQTRQVYLREAEKFVRYLNGKEITKDRTMLYREKLREEDLSPATINLYVIAVNRYLRYLECGQASIKTLKVQKKCSVENVISRKEYQELLNYAKRSGRIVYDSDKYETTPAVVASKKMLNAAGVVLQRYEHTNRRIELEL